MTCQKLVGFGLAAALVVAVGCGKAGTAPTVKVTGTVTHNGQPVEGASVAFIPETGRPASGTTDASGRFTLSTFKSGDGAVPGPHKVAITEASSDQPEVEPDYSLPDATKSRFPARYADPKTSGFTATVEEGKENDFTFDMKD